MGTKKIMYRLRGGEVVDVEEYHDGNYGRPGEKRPKKAKPTPEQMRKVNERKKADRCRRKLLQYFVRNDLFVTWTYRVEARPASMEEAYAHFRRAIGKVRAAYRAKEAALYWIRNIEQGTKGAWHIHLVVNAIDGAEGIVRKAWTYGGTYIAEIRQSDEVSDDDFTKLAGYLTKDENTQYKNKDGTPGKTRIKAASYNSSRNMPLPEPKVKRLVRWKKEAKPTKGYRILRIHEGINPVTGYKYRRYTMVRTDNKKRKEKKE